MKSKFLFLTAIIGVASFAGLPSLPARSADSGSVSCSNAKSTLAQARAMMPATSVTTTDVDKDFAVTEYRMAQAQVVIGHVVAKCSKSKTNRDAALQMIEEAQQRMALFRNQSTSL